jgi:lipopolysaccharide/colanic/teichoic acid biosynthesis glycosyltransferase
MNRFPKWLMDVFIGGAALLLLAPLMAVIALVILLAMGRPELFRHVRPGYKPRPLVLLKFRTMNYLCDAQGRLEPHWFLPAGPIRPLAAPADRLSFPARHPCI